MLNVSKIIKIQLYVKLKHNRLENNFHEHLYYKNVRNNSKVSVEK